MDRRQRKTRMAIFQAFIALLEERKFSQITVGQVIEKADVGRATFYAHFETKDDLLKALCGELFDHIVEAAAGIETAHTHIFDCDATNSVFLHLLQHLEKNDNHILDLLSGGNDELFLGYFKAALKALAANQLPMFAHRKATALPEELWVDHIASSFIEAVHWWIGQGRAQTPEQIMEYFFLLV